MSFLDCFHDTLNVALCQNSVLLIAGDNELIYQIESSFFIARVNSRLRTTSVPKFQDINLSDIRIDLARYWYLFFTQIMSPVIICPRDPMLTTNCRHPDVHFPCTSELSIRGTYEELSIHYVKVSIHPCPKLNFSHCSLT